MSEIPENSDVGLTSDGAWVAVVGPLSAQEAYEMTSSLRYALRNGERVLQQGWRSQATGRMRWWDVPDAREEDGGR